MEELITQCLQEIAEDTGSDLRWYMEHAGLSTAMSKLAAKLLAKGVQLPAPSILTQTTYLADLLENQNYVYIDQDNSAALAFHLVKKGVQLHDNPHVRQAT